MWGMGDRKSISERADLLQEMAGDGVESLAVLTNALGNQAATLMLRNPNVQLSSMRHVTQTLNGILDLLDWQVREFAHLKATGSAPDDPLRALDPEAFDKGARINGRAVDLQRVASRQLEDGEALVALQTALGNHIAVIVARRNPEFPPDQNQHMIDETVDAVCVGLRDATYLAADLPSVQPDAGGRDLTDEEFNSLTQRIIHAATKNNTPVTDAVSATAKALAVQISILSKREGVSLDDLIHYSQEALATFTREALNIVQENR